jgi:hypothetical protein
VSDVSQGPGWWLASDGKWYAPYAPPSQEFPYSVGGFVGTPVPAPDATGIGYSGKSEESGLGHHQGDPSAPPAPSGQVVVDVEELDLGRIDNADLSIDGPELPLLKGLEGFP